MNPAQQLSPAWLPEGFSDEPLAPPHRNTVLAETRVVRELPRLLLHSPRLATAQRGQGAPVMVMPGIGTTDAVTAPLRGYLSYLGHDARGWGIGRNHGDVPALVPQVLAAVAQLAEDAAEPVHLVGWSLGGVLAREVAREQPDLVAQVITYGTPVVGGPAYTLAAQSYGADTVAAIQRQVAERNRVPIEVPVTAIYTRRDNVVAWRACIDTVSPDIEHVEVGSTHVGLGIDPDVWLEIARRLAAATSRTRPAPRARRPGGQTPG